MKRVIKYIYIKMNTDKMRLCRRRMISLKRINDFLLESRAFQVNFEYSQFIIYKNKERIIIFRFLF